MLGNHAGIWRMLRTVMSGWDGRHGWDGTGWDVRSARGEGRYETLQRRWWLAGIRWTGSKSVSGRLWLPGREYVSYPRFWS